MIMQQTLFIVILAVVIVFALAYRWKKKAENKMGNMSLNYKSNSSLKFEIMAKQLYVASQRVL